MPLSHFFEMGKKIVKNFVKAKTNIPNKPAGETLSPEFRQVGKSPTDKSGYKVEHTN